MIRWVTESPHGFNGRSLPLSYRFHSAMMGGLGIGANISKWSTEELEKAKRYVELYKEIRPVILNGDLYRLSSLRVSNVAVYQYNSTDRSESVVFTFLQSQHFGSEVRHLLLQGLVSHASYEVNIDEGEPFVRQGSTLMNLGVAVSLRGDYKSIMIRIKRLD
ncbi:GH36 C-terminal domain-containing protein [Paenibacillus sp. LjRoot56]|uniref:GH36 C-terminal domain-containing protein n=1 Tax=Paenibacillus sp. LjRoot56 TaxID=3342333 RepID=UPI003ECF9148